MIYDLILISEDEAQLIVDGTYLGLMRYDDIQCASENKTLIPVNGKRDTAFIGAFTIKYYGLNIMFATGSLLITDARSDRDKYQTFLDVLGRRQH